MTVFRVKARWSGFTGSPGYTVLHFAAPAGATTAGAQSAADAARTFFAGVASNLPAAVKINIESIVEVIDETTDTLETMLTVSAGTAIAGGLATGFAASAGACVIWETGEVKRGRRVRGRTFLVPLASTVYEEDGTIKSTNLTDMQDAATALAGSGFEFGVLSRPSAPGAADGTFHTVSSGRISDKAAVLRSRRD